MKQLVVMLLAGLTCRRQSRSDRSAGGLSNPNGEPMPSVSRCHQRRRGRRDRRQLTEQFVLRGQGRGDAA